nr:MAG TPA: hypothetical protein [Caudoviricetes sp.]
MCQRRWLSDKLRRTWFDPSWRNYQTEAEVTENFTFDGRYDLLDRMMQVPVSLLITAIIYGWGFWLGVVTG